jgi:hypothetical protein
MSEKQVLNPFRDALLVLNRYQFAAEYPDHDEEGDAASVKHGLHNSAPASRTHDIELLVSSRHLALACCFFRVMFDGGFREDLEPKGGRVPRQLVLRDEPAPCFSYST